MAWLSGKWDSNSVNLLLGQDVHDSVVGFYGFGGIGQEIAKRLSGFHIGQVFYTSLSRVHKDIEQVYNAKKVGFNELLGKSDFVVITEPLKAGEKNVFNADAFNKMKNTGVLINVANGSK